MRSRNPASSAQLRQQHGLRQAQRGARSRKVASMLAKKPEIAQTIITHRYPIEDAPEAFRAAAARNAGAIKVVIDP